MTYLVAQIWLFIVVAAAIGLLFGWMFRGGVSAARLRELRFRLAHAEAEASEQRREAAELAARAERKGRGSLTASDAHIQVELRTAREHINRLEMDVREARAAANRHSEEAEELRYRIAELSTGGESEPTDEVKALRARVRDLEDEADDLRDRLVTQTRHADDELHAQIAELEAEGEDLRARLDAAQAAADTQADANERVADLEAATESLRAQLDAARAAQGDQETQAARITELEAEIEALRNQAAEAPAAPVEVPDDAPLRARIAELEGEIETLRAQAAEAPAAPVEAPDDAPLRIRIAELEGEVEGFEARLDHARAEARGELQARVDDLTAEIESLKSAAAQEHEAGAADAAEELAAARDEAERLRDELAEHVANAEAAETLRERVAQLEAAAQASRSAASEASVNGEDMDAARLRWRMSYLTSRIHFLEAKLQETQEQAAASAVQVEDGGAEDALAALRAENEALQARLAELQNGEVGPDRSAEPPPNVEGGGGSLEWRNRYLASRVRYLELQLEEKGEEGRSASEEELRQKLADAEAEAAEAIKLRKRVGELEREREKEIVARNADPSAKSEGEFALEWRNRYLSSRVKYLEDRLAKVDTPVPVEPS